jgi:glutamine synthetase
MSATPATPRSAAVREMTAARPAVRAALNGNGAGHAAPTPTSAYFGTNTFGARQMRDRLPKKVYQKLQAAIRLGKKLDADIAAPVAEAIKEWAIEKGVTHFTHWFQPQTGLTAEKHDAFLSFDDENQAIESFGAAQLIQSEPDASSFPSGGLRATWEARGYTAWNPASPVFVVEGPGTRTLCIPSVFVGYNGEALDEMTPLLRSSDVLSARAIALLALLGDTGVQRVTDHARRRAGVLPRRPAQFALRPDLSWPGARSSAPRRRAGSSSRTTTSAASRAHPGVHRRGRARALQARRADRHAAQRGGAEPVRDGAALHRGRPRHRSQPARDGDAAQGRAPPRAAGDPAREAVRRHQRLGQALQLGALDRGRQRRPRRAQPAQAGEDAAPEPALPDLPRRRAAGGAQARGAPARWHRDGGQRAPARRQRGAAGDHQRVHGADARPHDRRDRRRHASGEHAAQQLIQLGVAKLPEIEKDNTDRNRTSPFAFTGNKFEFRAVGSSQSIAFPVMLLNAAVAEAIADLTAKLREELKRTKAVDDAVLAVVRESFRQSSAVRFEGNGYSEEWVREAEGRGLKNLRRTPEALEELMTAEAKALFASTGILTDPELESRYHVRVERYVKDMLIEVDTLTQIVDTLVLPAAYGYANALARGAAHAKQAGIKSAPQVAAAERVGGLIEALEAARTRLGEVADRAAHMHGEPSECGRLLTGEGADAIAAVRAASDALELVLPDDQWPLPKYREMLFPV